MLGQVNTTAPFFLTGDSMTTKQVIHWFMALDKTQQEVAIALQRVLSSSGHYDMAQAWKLTHKLLTHTPK
jgi:hypothetical protein